MSYSEITFNDRNRIKNWLQYQRLESALKLAYSSDSTPAVICDYGSGNGELCKLLAKVYPGARIICYEPSDALLSEAYENLNGVPNVEFLQDINCIQRESIDLVFCLEVLEHLPGQETEEALTTISSMLKSKGKLVIGIPVEIGIPALYKGLFRMTRRYGAFDANIKNILLSLLGNPPKRHIREISPGFRYIYEHTGFDFRQLKKLLGRYFIQMKVTASPVAFLGPWLMPEVYFTVEKNVQHCSDTEEHPE